MSNFIYFRGVRHVSHTVFCVDSDGQKTYYDSVLGKRIPYGSGQQVKRSLIDAMLEKLDKPRTPYYFGFKEDGKAEINLKEDVVLSYCDPSYPDLLVGGWWNSYSKENSKIFKNEISEVLNYTQTLKRRSPLSFSAFVPVHGYAVSTTNELISLDRRDDAELQKMFVKRGDSVKVGLPYEFLNDYDPMAFKMQKYIGADKNLRVTGIFQYDIAIDLRTLFCVSLSKVERNITDNMAEKLKTGGWVETSNGFGPCLLCPEEKRNEIIPALAYAMINWQITSNQSRTFGLPSPLAFGISQNASDIPLMIRAEEIIDKKVEIVFDESYKDNLFVTNAAKAYVNTNLAKQNAIEMAQDKLIELMKSHKY